MELVSLQNVGFTYAYADKPALRNVSLKLEPGLVYGVVGLNASGKSTLCNVIRGTIPHFHDGEMEGQVRILDQDLTEWDPAALSKAVGFVFQNPFTQISGVKDTVFEEIALGLENLGIPREEMIERVTAVVKQLGLESLIRKNPNELSGGQRQKVAFASIIVMDADFLVIDEPTSQLDPESSEAVFEIIRGLKDQGKSIILVEHKIDLMAEYADRLVVMKAGEAILEGPTRDVLVSTEFADAGVPRPELTELALTLETQGKELSSLPITRAEAHQVISHRMKEASNANYSL